MKIKIGNDIVQIKRIVNLNEKTLNKIFHKTELNKPKSETLAGVFAAKEACKKVFNNLNWLDIEIKKKKNGKPILILNKEKIKNNILDYDISISHDGGFAIANVIFILNN